MTPEEITAASNCFVCMSPDQLRAATVYLLEQIRANGGGGGGSFVPIAGGTMTGALGIIAGTKTAPGIFFSGDTDTGFYQAAANRIYVSCADTQVGYFNSTSLRMLDGTSAAPSYAFTAATSSGFYHAGSGSVGYTRVGVLKLVFGDESISFGASTDTILLRDGAANTLALRNGSSAQTLRVYNTYTDASNYERGVFDWSTTANVLTIGTTHAGTGVARPLYFRVGGTDRWGMSQTGHFVAIADNAYDIGASGATRPRTIYVGTSVIVGSNVTATSGTVTGGLVSATSANVAYIFGSSAATHPGLKRSGTIIQARLADDSAYAPTEASYTRTATAYTVATLPAAATAGAGARAYVTDANATTYMSTVAGGGANIVPVFSDGTNWKIA